MSNVVVHLGTRRATIKTHPNKSLSDIRTEAVSKFALNLPSSSYTLRRNGRPLDLTLSVRLANLAPGAKLELIRATAGAKNELTEIQLRLADPDLPGGQITGKFPSANMSIWQILRKLESVARESNSRVNITERPVDPSTGAGSGRLLYQMPCVMVLGTNKELTTFEELGKTLSDLGVEGGRVALKMRFKQSDLPLDEVLVKMQDLDAEGSGDVMEKPVVDEKPAAKESVKDSEGDSEMADSPAPEPDPIPSPPTPDDSDASRSATASAAILEPDPETERTLHAGGIAVYQPPTSSTIAAANLDTADKDYELGIADFKRIKESIHKDSLPQRLLSNKELEEKERASREKMERVSHLRIKVKFPDGFTTVKEFGGKSTANDLYDSVRAMLRHPDQPFILLEPPSTRIAPTDKRLTVDYKVTSGVTLHLRWSDSASAAAKSEPALKEELSQTAMELPKPVVPDAVEEKEEVKKGEEKKKEPQDRKSKEAKLKGLLGFGKKK